MGFVSRVLMILFFSFFSQTIFAQTKVLFTYDASGNRIQRSADIPEPEPAMLLFEEGPVITEVADSGRIVMYADKDKETINIEFENKKDNTAMSGGYVLYDAGGRIVKKSQSSESEFCVELSSLPRGLYVIYISYCNRTVGRKIRLN